MKKILLCILSVLLCMSFAGCANKIKGETHVSNRLSVLVPEGWTLLESSGTEDSAIAMAKGENASFGQAPTVVIYYYLPTQNVFSSKYFYENAEDLEEFDAAGFRYAPWKFEQDGIMGKVLESFGEKGSDRRNGRHLKNCAVCGEQARRAGGAAAQPPSGAFSGRGRSFL